VLVEEARIIAVPPNTLITVAENKYCVVLKGTVKVRTPHSLREMGARSIFKAEGIICSGEKGCEFIIFDPGKHQLPDNIRRKIRQLAAEEEATDEKNGQAGTGAHQLLYDKHFRCPVCATEFTAQKVRTTKLKSKNLDTDLRTHYEGINPLLYNVILCPGCFYANFSEDFEDLSAIEKTKLSSERRTFRQDNSSELETAIEKYKLALKCIQTVNGTPEKLAKAYLHLAWLYEDTGENNLAVEMRQNALTCYKQAFSSSSHLQKPQLEQITYLIGELSLQLGHLKEAYDYFQQLIQDKDTAPWLKKQTRQRILDLRARMAEESPG
jgi:hypothetical protein